jgi:hypothetical protein
VALGLLGIQRGEVQPRECVCEVAPDSFNGVELGAVRGQAHQAHVRGEDKSLGGMRATVVQEQARQAVREGLGKGVDEELKALGGQIWPCQEEASPRRGLHGAIDVEPLKDVRHYTDGLHPTGREAAATDGEPAEAACILAEDADGARMGGRERLLQAATTAGLEGRKGFRVFWCGLAAPR